MPTHTIHATAACNLDTAQLQTMLPLFEGQEIDAIEWSFDTLYQFEKIPPWFNELIEAFSYNDRLIGHGVFFSIFEGKWKREQAYWLKKLESLCNKFRFSHISEHFGFMTGIDFHHGAPMSIPYSSTTRAIGIDRLMRIANVCQCPVGLENLAFAFSLEEVKIHGVFLDELLDPINGFLILDLHNLYCQIKNFNIPFEQLIQCYPLERVREIHISGGSWEASDEFSDTHIRRDTHDDNVPEEVFNLLRHIIRRCPNLTYVVLEQIGGSLKSVEAQKQFREDFRTMKNIIRATEFNTTHHHNHFQPPPFELSEKPLEDFALHRQQMELSNILESAGSVREAKGKLTQSTLANTAWKIEEWDEKMIETSMKIAKKWALGYIAPL